MEARIITKPAQDARDLLARAASWKKLTGSTRVRSSDRADARKAIEAALYARGLGWDEAQTLMRLAGC